MLFVDFAVLGFIALTSLTRRVDRAGFGVPGWTLLGLGAATVLSIALLVTEPWFRGHCGRSVLTLVTTSFDMGPEGLSPGCRGAQAQANFAFVAEAIAIVVAAVVFATRPRRSVSPGR
ncbi:hypothetical protein [Cellulomonas rhizosphaerae]|uniref:Uncharacterized protein n=1 Tax=Cellulomonas rhizosphaerae TaxID=2293719 RepID=A0A413RHI7_9CELL|nr:hypothetical protein [Cellulomonas rhizosphaerae]RHA37586.1 hypothetical protein D1825_17135 [Cellulomonas rhizosphaerae]